ncbi:hypothetical protein KTT_53030 [Tengunoibacter tsumagoiensis]|uniref:Uncharacterized protein n=1 Tax=Tengunoibacter tsumagoiensis TaxID=2014871 RepID=A0A402A8F5_9CHLR|nr:hypothetical protein KTT_53030 [Tengunoibacter tsumagoiensis]
MFGNGLSHINTLLFHNLSGQRMNPICWLTSCTDGLDGSLAQMTEKGFRHLGSRAVLRTQKQNSCARCG